MISTNISAQEKSDSSLVSQQKPSLPGLTPVKSSPSELRPANTDTPEKIFLPPRISPINPISVTVAFPPEDNPPISNDRLTSFDLDIQTILLSKILDQVSTSNEKDFSPFWTPRSKELSEKLWLPTGIACVDSVLTCSNTSSPDVPMGRSWFSIKEKLPLKKNLSMISSPSSQYSLLGYTDLGAIPSNTNYTRQSKKNVKSKKNISFKTLKGRLLPTPEQKTLLQLMMDQSRWYYNFLVDAFQSKLKGKENIKKLDEVSYPWMRCLLSQYDYIEESDEVRYFQVRQDQTNVSALTPPWWDKPHSRIARGVAKKFSQNINSILSNYHNGNIQDFDLHYRSKKKSKTEFVLFEDKNFPVFLREIKSQYWYTDKNGRKQRSSFKELFEQTEKRGVEIIYDKLKDHYYFSYPVDYNFYPENDRRNESQVNYVSSPEGERVISLDPGVRKFLVGYDPDGKMIFIGEGASKEIARLMLEIDECKDRVVMKRKWRIIKNKITELHWKTISYLTARYDKIMMPDFRISKMVKGKKLNKMTKRLLYMFSYYSFIEKLKFKCKNTKTRLYIVDESYTSKTCTRCGQINNVGASERYECERCRIKIDRDVNGSRNIMLKNMI